MAFIAFKGLAQEKSGAQQFWNNLKNHCGNTYEGTIVEAPEDNSFKGKKLIMHVRSCSENIIRIPFFVGEDKSRTWVLKLENDRIQLKHDHRRKDGTPDEVTQYGGTTPNSGLPNIQFFPADQQTADLIPYASTNVWWIVLEDTIFTYNLRKTGSNRLFSVKFDLSKQLPAPTAPSGSED